MPSSPGSSPSSEQHAPDAGADRPEAERAAAERPEGARSEADAAPGGPADGAAGGDGATTPSTDELQAQIAKLEDRYKRALADLDNYRKRTAVEIERRVEETGERLLRDWLDAVDSVERALGMDSDSTLAQGLRAVLDQMEAILARQGVTRIGEAGEPFDPERHEAIAVRETADVPDRTIIEVARSGWAMGDRVLRPAQVVVSRRPQSDG
jgi:molecular chaperone GrpE